MYIALHYFLMTCYKALPIAALMLACFQTRKYRTLQPIAAFLITFLSGVILGTCVVLIYAVLLRGEVPFGQFLIACYFVTSLLLIVASVRWFFRWCGRRWVRSTDASFRPPKLSVGRFIVGVLQPLAIACLALPFLVGTMLVNRVRIRESQTPLTLVGCASERVTFPALDSVRISAWWTPAQLDPFPRFERQRHQFASRTVIMCGGLTDDLSDQAGLVGLLVRSGYNVLFISLRGHDDSQGQWTTFGDAERWDVLGAVRWLKENHLAECERIEGVGGGIGGAAVIAAATDSNPLGQDIDAVAIYGTYARFNSFAENLFNSELPRPAMWWMMHLMVPVASANTGFDLAHFAPVDLVPQLWPRPILFFQGRADALFPAADGEELFERASFPKQLIWLSTDHAGAYHSRTAAAALLDFLDHAQPSPVI
jgi:pimeloyl-ACP methyl ester carboxylesterase